MEGAGGEGADDPSADGAATSIHDAVRVKEPGLADLLVYDAYERRSGLVRVLSSKPPRRTGRWHGPMSWPTSSTARSRSRLLSRAG